MIVYRIGIESIPDDEGIFADIVFCLRKIIIN
ncbi:MAG: hypothetical protein ACI9FO_001051 [Methylophagaceae bacterium]|jgi:hypothetical protein